MLYIYIISKDSSPWGGPRFKGCSLRLLRIAMLGSSNSLMEPTFLMIGIAVLLVQSCLYENCHSRALIHIFLSPGEGPKPAYTLIYSDSVPLPWKQWGRYAILSLGPILCIRLGTPFLLASLSKSHSRIGKNRSNLHIICLLAYSSAR